MSKHALLSASSSHRWLHCPPSARLTENYDDLGSNFAAEGTDAHLLCEYKLRCALGKELSLVTDIRATLSYYSEEMENCTEDYTAFILELVETAKQASKDHMILIEQRLDFCRYVMDGFGTADCLIVTDDVLDIVDFKYGCGVLVEVDHNPQLMLYALGALEMLDGIYDITTTRMTVFQPRRNNICTFVMSKDDLYRWAKETLKPAADLAFTGQGEFSCGEWCQFCKAKYSCRTRTEFNMALAAYDFQLPPLMDDEEIGCLLGKLDDLIAWATDIKDYALKAAVSGKHWTGWKLVESRTNRRYISDVLAADRVKAAGLDPFEHKIMGITAMSDMLGTKRFQELLGDLVERPQGKPTLVPDTDKRPAITIYPE